MVYLVCDMLHTRVGNVLSFQLLDTGMPMIYIIFYFCADFVVLLGDA